MKSKFIYWQVMSVMLMVLGSGCSTMDADIAVSKSNHEMDENESSFRTFGKARALDIADKVLKKTGTRSAGNEPTYEYIVKDPTLSSMVVPDTMAYVVNYPDNEGFVIVANYDHVYPVLAYSNTGNFTFDNEIAKANFVDNIGAYIEAADPDETFDVSDDDFDGCYISNPVIDISLSQKEPWDYYVYKLHPGCPVGCVAVATALVMSYSKETIKYHNTSIDLKDMILTLSGKVGLTPTGNSVSTFGLGDIGIVDPNKNKAVKQMAKMLQWIGEDLNMIYSPKGSVALSSDAYKLCDSLGFDIPSGYVKFNIDDVARYIKAGHIVYLKGRDYRETEGHAWVADGTHFCVDYNDRSKIIDCYIHCDWGWGGDCNGYYSGSVFSAKNYHFNVQKYFAVKREW